MRTLDDHHVTVSYVIMSYELVKHFLILQQGREYARFVLDIVELLTENGAGFKLEQNILNILSVGLGL